MPVDEAQIRECCTDAVLERGERYREEGRVARVDRFGSLVAATVVGSRRYDVSVDVSAPGFDAACTCPYARSGACKHVVAVLLEVAADPPDDGRGRVEAVLDDAGASELRSFVVDELAGRPELRDRLLAWFGEPTGKSVAEYRAAVSRLFEARAADGPVVVALDFSRFTDLAERYRARGEYGEAARVYRALAEGVEENVRVVDAGYDHYEETFRAALDGYVECVRAADLSDEEVEAAVGALSARAAGAAGYLADEYEAVIETLRSDW